jgi:hypothetical protein
MRAPTHRRRLTIATECQYALLCGLICLIPRIWGSVSEIAAVMKHELRADLPLTEHLAARLGEEALTPRPLEVVQIAREQQLVDYALSPALANDVVMLQRVTEGAWPIQLEPTSHHLFLRKGEPLPRSCQLRHRGREVDYADCS